MAKLNPSYYASLNTPREASDRDIIRVVRQDLAPAFLQSPVWKPMRQLFIRSVLDHHQSILETQSSH